MPCSPFGEQGGFIIAEEDGTGEAGIVAVYSIFS